MTLDEHTLQLISSWCADFMESDDSDDRQWFAKKIVAHTHEMLAELRRLRASLPSAKERRALEYAREMCVPQEGLSPLMDDVAIEHLARLREAVAALDRLLTATEDKP